jgi:L-rhamnose mutarotase
MNNIVSFKMKLKPGFKEEYKRRHDLIWPELSTLLTDAGISNYSIFLDEETNILFAVQTLSGNNNSQDLRNTEIVKKWWAYMADIMDTNEDNSPISKPLETDVPHGLKNSFNHKTLVKPVLSTEICYIGERRLFLQNEIAHHRLRRFRFT